MGEFCDFKQKSGETYQEYIRRFSNLEIKLKNQQVRVPNIFMGAFLIRKSKLSEMEKNNVLATTDVENSETLMKVLKKKVREIDALKTTDVKETLYGDFRAKTPERRNYQNNFQQDGRRTSARKPTFT